MTAKRFILIALVLCLFAGCAHLEDDEISLSEANPTPESKALELAQWAEVQALLREAETQAAMRETLAYLPSSALGLAPAMLDVSITLEQNIIKRAREGQFVFPISAENMRKKAREREAKALDTAKDIAEMRAMAAQAQKEQEFMKALRYEEYSEALEKEAEASRMAGEAWKAAAQARETAFGG